MRSRLGPLAVILGATLLSCTPRTAPTPQRLSLSLLTLRADTARVDTLAAGVVHYAFVVDSAPWRIHVLDVDRAACYALESAKAAGEAVGRELTSMLLREQAPIMIGAVNADFFLFTPPGVPTGASIHRGRVVTGPGTRPIFATNASGTPWIGTLTVEGAVEGGGNTFPLTRWNRASDSSLAWFDASWGAVTDTASGTLRLVLGDGPDRAVLAIDSSGKAITIPSHGGVLVVGAFAPDSLRHAMLHAARLRVTVALAPFAPREAVGGFPVLVRDSTEVAGLERAGGANFGPVRHPRTIVGLASGGRRVLLVTVDGRQPGYSAGMTLREAAALMLALGATEALNLDGGGSTAMVLQDRYGGIRIANRPSDKEGERPVANALGVVRGCR